jgi:DNA-binding XRE family transcriptional regulator
VKTNDPTMSPAADPNETFIDDLSDLVEEINNDPIRSAKVRAASAAIDAAQVEHALGLQQLRASFGLTQTELASTLGISQANIAQTEHRSDLLISTLRRYVEGITGGELCLTVEFPDRPPLRFELKEVGDSSPADGRTSGNHSRQPASP